MNKQEVRVQTLEINRGDLLSLSESAHFKEAQETQSLISYQLSVTYLQEFINFNLPVLVEVHLVQNFMQCVFINVDVDALQRNKSSDQ